MAISALQKKETMSKRTTTESKKDSGIT